MSNSSSNSASFSAALAQGVLVFDGAMGTEIYRHHVFTNRCFDELCLSDPQLIRRIHSDYCDAGADVLTTNTYGANRVDLGKFGLSEQRAAINRAARSSARQIADAAGRPIYVAGSIGPLPSQPQYEDQIEAMIVEQANSLTEGGADFVLFETQPSRRALEQCALAMARLPEVPFALSFALIDGESASGESVEILMAPLPGGASQPVAWGLNCGTGPDGLLGAVERTVRLTSLPVIVQPNAGLPKEVEHRRIYFCSPEYLTEYAKRFVSLGAGAVGGCCGTTPDHIREIAKTIKPLQRAGSAARRSRPPRQFPLSRPPPLRRSRGSPTDWRTATGLPRSNSCLRAATTSATRSPKARFSTATASMRSTFPTAPGPARGFPPSSPRIAFSRKP